MTTSVGVWELTRNVTGEILEKAKTALAQGDYRQAFRLACQGEVVEHWLRHREPSPLWIEQPFQYRWPPEGQYQAPPALYQKMEAYYVKRGQEVDLDDAHHWSTLGHFARMAAYCQEVAAGRRPELITWLPTSGTAHLPERLRDYRKVSLSELVETWEDRSDEFAIFGGSFGVSPDNIFIDTTT